MTAADDARARSRADEFLRLLADDDAAADALLDGLPGVRDLVFLGAALTGLARSEGRRLPPAQRAQASTRQVRLGLLRDARRGDPAGLRTWLRRSGEEVLLLRSLRAAAERADGMRAERQGDVGCRVAPTATGSMTASSPQTAT